MKEETKVLWLVICLAAALPFLGFWLTGLTDLDEGYYGAVAAEMNRRGEWLIPFYNGSPWFEKPILLYWLAKPSLMLFGEVVGPRLPSVVCSLGTLAVVAWFCRRRLSDDTAKWAVLILSGSILFGAAGQMMLADPSLTLFLTAAFLTFYESLLGDRRWRLVTAACLGFAVLAKGPVALVLFGAVAGLTYYLEPWIRHKFRGYWLLGTGILLAVLSLWYLPVYLARPDGFVQEFLIRQNLQRFTGGDAAHSMNWALGLAFYAAILLVGFMPWSLWWKRSFREAKRDSLERPILRFLLGWALVVWLLFTISAAKLPHYILPAMPPLAIVLGHYLAQPKLRQVSMKWGIAWVVVLAAIMNAGLFAWYRGWFPGTASQAEAHELARFMRDQKGPVALFRLSRPDASLGTGKVEIQQTMLPSMLFYLDSNVLMPRAPREGEDPLSDVKELIAAPKPLWVFTREGRITPEIQSFIERSQHTLELAKAGPAGDYLVYKLDVQ
ncbi:MAG: glycosyltransferase family 39 protein [Fimbriimonadaceae bacterium]